MRNAIAMAVAGAAILVAGCGGGRLSHEEFVGEVKALCQTANQRRAEVSKGFDFESFDPDTSDLSMIVPIIEGNVAIGRESDRELAKLRGPESDERKLQEMLEIGRRRYELGEQEAAAARAGDRKAFKELTAREDAIALPQDEPYASC